MQQEKRAKRVCVFINSPAWEYYVREGWTELWSEGHWVTMVKA